MAQQAADNAKKRMDSATEQMLARLIRQRTDLLSARAAEEGVLAYCRQPVQRERLNERFLQNTLRGVFSSNKRATEALMWETRDAQRDREIREQAQQQPRHGGGERRHEAEPSDRSRGGRHAERRGRSDDRSRSHSRGRDRHCSRSRSRSRRRGHDQRRSRSRDRRRSRSPSPLRSRSHSGGRARRRRSSSPRKQEQRAADGGTLSGSSSGRSESPTSSRSSSGTASGGSSRGGADGADGDQGGEEAWIMTDEELQAMLNHHRLRGRGGVGSRAEETGPFLPTDEAGSSAAARGPLGPEAPTWLRTSASLAAAGVPGASTGQLLMAADPGLARLLKRMRREEAKPGEDESSPRKKRKKEKKSKKAKDKEKKRHKKSRKSKDGDRRDSSKKDRHAKRKRSKGSRSSSSSPSRSS